jgi:hypothetical protein
VHGKEANLTVGIKSVLRSVAVMYVPIDDENPSDAMLDLRDTRGDGNVIKQAESHRAIAKRMVTGRADEAERGPCLASYDAIDRIAGRAGGKLSHIGRGRADDRVWIKHAAAAPGSRHHAVDMRGHVHSL